MLAPAVWFAHDDKLSRAVTQPRRALLGSQPRGCSDDEDQDRKCMDHARNRGAPGQPEHWRRASNGAGGGKATDNGEVMLAAPCAKQLRIRR